MKVGVLGVGAMGSLFGGSLKLAGYDVKLIFRNKKNQNLVNKNGLKLNLDSGKHIVYPNAIHTSDNHTFDLILILTKTTHTFNALSSIKHLIKPLTVLMSLQNGLGNDLVLSKFTSKSNVIYGTSMAPADLIHPGEVTSHGTHVTHFRPLGKLAINHAQNLETMLNNAGLKSYINQNVDNIIWNKIAFNTAINCICALIEDTPKEIEMNIKLKKFAEDVANETCTVAKSLGVQIDNTKVRETINLSCREHGDHKPSMLQDVLLKNQTEIDSLNGTVVSLAQKQGVPVPLNISLVSLIKAKQELYKLYR